MRKQKPLPRELTQSCMELALEIAQGPRLFDDAGRTTEAVERYNGNRLTRDLDRCVVVGALRTLAYSDRQIAEAVGCDVRSIPLMLEAAEKSGRIPALKDRLARLTGQNAERSQIALAQLLNRASDGRGDLDMAAMIKAVATAGGIATQNVQLLTGGPTEILEHRVGAGREEIEAWARSLAVPVEATVVGDVTAQTDMESPANALISKQIGANGAARHEDVTSAGAAGADQLVGEGEADAAPGGRGGCAISPGGAMGDGSTGF